jgi:hypothetical protein
MQVKAFPSFKRWIEVSSTQEEAILCLYSILGWDKKTDIDPTKVKISIEDWSESCNLFGDLFGSSSKYFFMNYGPSASQQVKKNFVFLQDTWCNQ